MMKHDILVYEGRGASPIFIRRMLRMEVDPSRHRIVPVDAKDVIDGRVFDRAALFIMPGGAGTPYCEDLSGIGFANIRQFGCQGGTIHLYCAAAYPASCRMTFNGKKKQMDGAGELALFDGTAIGSDPAIAAPYDGTLSTAAVAAVVSPSGKRFHLHYHGGPQFQPNPGASFRPILWTGDLANRRLVALEVPVGAGKANLYGVHAEVGGYDLEDSLAGLQGGEDYRKNHLPRHKASEAARRQFIRRQLSQAGVSLSSLADPDALFKAGFPSRPDIKTMAKLYNVVS